MRPGVLAAGTRFGRSWVPPSLGIDRSHPMMRDRSDRRGRAESMTSVLIVDAHRMFVDSLVRLLSDQPEFEVVDVANSVGEAVRAVRKHDPQVVLLDFRL